LIYARQDQTLANWKRELSSALDLAIDHLSLYQLTIEEGTAFADRFAKGGLKGLPDENLSADMYEVTQELCDKAGLPAYEVSNHAKVGAESQHNLIYWRGGDYIGIGPGAHGRLTLNGVRWATESPKAPGLWLSQVESGSSAELLRCSLTPEEHGMEYLLMSLRLSEGLDLRRYEAITGSALSMKKIANLTELGMVRCAGGRLAATSQGRIVLNAVLGELAAP
jgi:oxygen-independent coproporphyrinogen-3 oxidase